MIRQMHGHQGQRLADMALNMIDVVDRNLYERSCDVNTDIATGRRAQAQARAQAIFFRPPRSGRKMASSPSNGRKAHSW